MHSGGVEKQKALEDRVRTRDPQGSRANDEAANQGGADRGRDFKVKNPGHAYG